MTDYRRPAFVIRSDYLIEGTGWLATVAVSLWLLRLGRRMGRDAGGLAEAAVTERKARRLLRGAR